MKGLRWLLYLPFCKWGDRTILQYPGPSFVIRSETPYVCNIDREGVWCNPNTPGRWNIILNWIDDLNQCHVIRIISELLLNYTWKLSLLYTRNHPYIHPVNRFWGNDNPVPPVSVTLLHDRSLYTVPHLPLIPFHPPGKLPTPRCHD